jgi:hypothetical protein
MNHGILYRPSAGSFLQAEVNFSLDFVTNALRKLYFTNCHEFAVFEPNLLILPHKPAIFVCFAH